MPFKKNNIPWNKGKKNVQIHAIGWQHSQETKKKMSLAKLGIKLSESHRAKMSESRKKRVGELAPSWIDGRSFFEYPKEFNRAIKNFIRNRDGYICRGCGMTESKHLDLRNQRLHIHHIDYNKENCIESNLITLCYRCNSGANKDRVVKEKHYNNIILNIYE